METRRRKARIESDGSALEAEEGGVAGGYEESRKKRIEENKLRLQKLGILDLSQKLKSELRSPKSKSPLRKLKKHSSMPLMMRSSSRLKSKPSVNYSELRAKSTKIKKSRDVVVRIKRGLKPEIYTEEDQKLLGECGTVWTLAVDGYENGKRVYDPLNGTSCHQCRQKTLGQHTECSKCGSGYGQLCGDCLYMRYGENVTEVSQNPNWVCPVCRDICNCSICRQAKGWAPTGNLYRKVIKLGYKSVAHYLIQARSLGSAEEQAVVALGSMNGLKPVENASSGGSADLEASHESSSTAESH